MLSIHNCIPCISRNSNSPSVWYIMFTKVWEVEEEEVCPSYMLSAVCKGREN